MAQILNANLPAAFQLAVDPVPVSTADSRAGADAATLPPGQILIQYAGRTDWHGGVDPGPNVVGLARVIPYPNGDGVRAPRTPTLNHETVASPGASACSTKQPN